MGKQIMDDYDAGFQAGQHDLNRIVVLREDLAYEKGLDRALFAVRNIEKLKHYRENLQTITKRCSHEPHGRPDPKSDCHW